MADGAPTPRVLDGDVAMIMALLRNVVYCLVDDSGAVVIDAVTVGKAICLRLSVSPKDLPQLIGHHGHVIRSLRTILSSVGARLDRQFYLEILAERS